MFLAFGTLAICDLSVKILRSSSQTNPSVGGDGLYARGVAKMPNTAIFDLSKALENDARYDISYY